MVFHLQTEDYKSIMENEEFRLNKNCSGNLITPFLGKANVLQRVRWLYKMFITSKLCK